MKKTKKASMLIKNNGKMGKRSALEKLAKAEKRRQDKLKLLQRGHHEAKS